MGCGMSDCRIEVYPTNDDEWSWHCWACETGQDYLDSAAEASESAAAHEESR